MNKEALEKLRDSVAARDPKYFDQNLPPRAYREKNHAREIPQGTPCGCVMFDAKKLGFFGQEMLIDLACIQQLGLTRTEKEWIFSSRYGIMDLARDLYLPIPQSFGPLDAAARIQQVIDGIFR